MGAGGARPGAGRKRKAEKFKSPIEQAERQIADSLPALVGNMFELAKGVFTEEHTLEGKRYVYQRIPDRAANEYLINRVMGKPVERKEVTGADGEPLFKIYEASDAFDPDSA